MPMKNSDKYGDPTEGMEELGAKLRSLREAQNLTYDDVTETIHVRPFVLQAIEEGRVLEVVDSVYARGFVKSYCEYLYADDLWKKYKNFFTSSAGALHVNMQDAPSSIGINHPTPMFRRSSMLWVYLILVLAVAGAGYLLWWQQKESDGGGIAGFFLHNNALTENNTTGSGENGNAFASGDIINSEDLPVAIYLDSSDRTISPAHRPSGDVRGIAGASVDLSWMDGNPTPNLAGSSAEPVAANAQRNTDNKLLIQITGAKCRLEVLRKGLILTSRTLMKGNARSYDITADTDVRFSDGAAARVVWRGATYEGVGEENSPVSFRFTPSGEMKLLKGQSQYGQ